MTKESQAAAEARGVGHIFPNGIVALENVNVTIPAGEVTAFIGRNGSGKTTLLRILGGLLRPTSGHAQMFGDDAYPPSTSMRSRIGYLSQSAELDPEMTGAETLSLFASLYALPHPARRARGERCAAEFELTEHLDRPVAEYSGGLRQRLHLAVGLLHEPDLLLLDEPTSALDPAGRLFVWETLQAFRAKGGSVVVVTHDLGEAARHAQNVVLFQRGKILATGSPAELIAKNARWNLLIETIGLVAQNSALPEQLGLLDGVTNVSCEETFVRVELSSPAAGQSPAGADRVMEFLASQSVGVASFRLSEPDLAGAYFRLTGEGLATPDAAVAGGRRGRVREGRAA